jgi:hypothetical protein
LWIRNPLLFFLFDLFTFIQYRHENYELRGRSGNVVRYLI